MTYQEQEEFNKLSELQKEDYLRYQQRFPNWDHTKLMTRVGFNTKIDDVVETQQDVDLNDKSIMQEIVEGVGRWLERTLPRIWQGVKDFFSGLLEGIWNGIVSTFESIFSLFD